MPAGTTVELTPRAVIESVGGLKKSLTDALDGSGSVTIDAASVESIDTAALQLLTSFVLRVEAAERAVTWHGVPTILRDAAAALDLENTLGFHEAVEADNEHDNDNGSEHDSDDDDLCPVF